MTTLLAAVVDASLVLALALLLCRLLHRRPAALRHAVLAAALMVAGAAPLLEATLPHWTIAVLPAPELTGTAVTFSSNETLAVPPLAVESARAPSLTWTDAVVAIWASGALVVVAGLLAGVMRLARMTRRCRPIRSGAWHELAYPIAVVESPDRPLLLTWGLVRPVIVVPDVATSWSVDRIQVVLAHELAHIRRRDWAIQIASETLRALYWFNPLVWMACRRLRDESEQACDDTVLERSVDATEYASHLLAVARQVMSDDRGWTPAPAVARSSTLERRIAAMLTLPRRREPLGRGAAALTVIGMLTVAMPLAAMTLTQRAEPRPVIRATKADIALPAPEARPVTAAPRAARPTPRPVSAAPVTTPVAAPVDPVATVVAVPADDQQGAPGSVSGVARDASGGVLPGVELTLTGQTGPASRRVTDGAGTFRFPDLQPGPYSLVAVLAGFSTLKMEFRLEAGQNLERRFDMRIGGLVESITVVCAPTGAMRSAPSPDVHAFVRRAVGRRLFTSSAPAAQAQQGLKPVRVGGNIMVPRQINKVNPICPGNIQPPATGTVVILEATIGTDGFVKDVKALRDPTPEFTEAAAQAVRQWQYTPTRLNNVPVPVIMTVTVYFTNKS